MAVQSWEGWREVLRRDAWQRLPEHVYRSLAAQLFRISWSVSLLEAGLVGVIGGLAAWRVQDALIAATTALTVLAVCLIPLTGMRAREAIERHAGLQAVRRAERRFELHVWAASAGIGLIAVRALLGFDDQLLHLTVIALVLGAAVTNVRDHFRPAVSFGKTIALLLPPSIAAIATSDPYYQVLGCMGLLAGKLVLDISRDLYGSSLALQVTLLEKDHLARELIASADALRRAQSALVQSSRLSAMGAMGSALAHELNQPLTAIANYTRGARRLLDRGAVGEDHDRAVQGIQAAEASALRAGEIVRSIRALVAGGQARRGSHDLHGLVRDACDLARADHEEAELTLAGSSEGMLVLVDPVQIHQVIVNLLRNSVEAGGGRARIRVTIEVPERPGEHFEIGIADDGPGVGAISDEELFAPFRSSREMGMGLGLSIARAIVEAHGGKIWCVRREQGAEFRFTIPAAEAAGSGAAVDGGAGQVLPDSTASV